MPKKLCKSLKIRLHSGLFVFMPSKGFTGCYSIVRFTLRINKILDWYLLSNTNLIQKGSIFLSNYRKTVVESTHVPNSVYNTFQNIENFIKSTLQNGHHSKNHLKYALNALKSTPNDLKSAQKQSGVFEIYSSTSLFSMNRVLISSSLT